MILHQEYDLVSSQSRNKQQKNKQSSFTSIISQSSVHSKRILSNKLYEKLQKFQDAQLINIQSSILILHEANILQVIKNIQSAKNMLNNSNQQNIRLRDQARFVYCLWKMINQQQIQTRQMKQVILMLSDLSLTNLKKQLTLVYSNLRDIDQFVSSWKVIHQQNQYYKAKQKQNARNNQNYDSIGYSKSKNLQKGFKQCHSNISSQSKLKKDKTLTTNYSRDLSKKHLDLSDTNNDDVSYVERLYQKDIYKTREALKEIQNQKKMKKQLQQCTFKPRLTDNRLRSVSNKKRSSSINGFNKTINRMHVGIQKQKIQKQKKQYLPKGQNYQKIRKQNIKPPKFLQREVKQQPVLFVIQFDIGRYKIKVKIHESDKQTDIAQNLCKIYTLKQDYYEQICLIIRKQRQQYEAEKALLNNII